MHFYLADRAAAARQSGARAVLLDDDGFVAEATTANVLVYREGEGLVSPPSEHILAGVSLGVVQELAGQLGMPFVMRPLTRRRAADCGRGDVGQHVGLLVADRRVRRHQDWRRQAGASFSPVAFGVERSRRRRCGRAGAAMCAAAKILSRAAGRFLLCARVIRVGLFSGERRLASKMMYHQFLLVVAP